MAAMTTATATATTTAAAPKEKADRWARRYVAGLEASSYSPSSPSLSSPSLSPSKKGRLGFGVVPQSIARDLKTSNSSNVASAASGPIVQSHDGTLAKVYGTLLEPQEAREQQWRCAGCHASFPRDATLYLAPRRAGGTSGPGVGNGSGTGPGARAEAAAAPGEAFCRPCYEKRFALGRCPGCDGVVLGSTKEQGTFVKTSEGNLWHGKCWATCAHCGQVAATAAANDIVEGILDGLPTCMSCFDDGPRRAQSKTSTNTKTNTKTTPAARDAAARSATIAEMTAKFRGPAPATAAGAAITAARPPMERRGSSSGSGSKSHERPASPSKPRPLTAQFSGSSFDLGRFVPSSSSSSSSISSADTGLTRSDSRGRSIVRDSRTASQQLLNNDKNKEQEHRCHRCGKGPFDEQEGQTTTTHTDAGTSQCSTMLALSGGTLFFHPACFCCAVCQRPIPGTASFASLGEQRYAHHGCAPRPIVAARPRLLDDARRHGDEATMASDRTALEGTATARTATARPAHDHVTLQRPTVAHSRDTSPAPLLPSSYLGSSSSDRSVSSASSSCSSSAVPFSSSSSSVSSSVSSSASSSAAPSAAPSSNRRFQSTAGAAPPTRSTLLSTRPSPLTGNVIKASLAMSSNGSNTPKSPLARLGAMPTCGGCARSLTSLEAVPGPRGSSWHPKCLVCTAPSTLAAGQGRRDGTICGKRLDSAAKVDTEGRVRCRGCFDRENARHRV